MTAAGGYAPPAHRGLVAAIETEVSEIVETVTGFIRRPWLYEGTFRAAFRAG
jgi:hypothetical protein